MTQEQFSSEVFGSLARKIIQQGRIIEPVDIYNGITTEKWLFNDELFIFIWRFGTLISIQWNDFVKFHP